MLHFQIPACVWTHCINPPVLPNMTHSWNGIPVNFGGSLDYYCNASGTYFSDDRTKSSHSLICHSDGTFDTTAVPQCVASK